MKYVEILKLSNNEILDLLNNAKKEYNIMILKKSNKEEIKNTSFKSLRKLIARYMTAINAKGDSVVK